MSIIQHTLSAQHLSIRRSLCPHYPKPSVMSVIDSPGSFNIDRMTVITLSA